MTNIITPREIVSELDKTIVGQQAAKRAVAIALRNRWRRMQCPQPMRDEINPKNILMIGPTGVGKTEVARRLAKLANAPFVKVEATKFTEVGYVGRDVESIIRDLMESAIASLRDVHRKKVKNKAMDMAEDKVLDVLLPLASQSVDDQDQANHEATRQVFRKKLREGQLDDKTIEITLPKRTPSVGVIGPPGMEEITDQVQSLFSHMPSAGSKRSVSVSHALKVLREQYEDELLDEEALQAQALESVEHMGIVFIDEIDKVVKRADAGGGDVSREGVQRDLLPLIEGCAVKTKYGMVNTDHILFIASGAFHLAKPADLIPELQGRLPIRVNLDALSVEDFVSILSEPDAALTKQSIALLATEGVHLSFTDDAIKKIAEMAWHINDSTDNIGARRLYTVMEYLLDDLLFAAPDVSEPNVTIDAACVEETLAPLMTDQNLSRFIL